MHWPDASRIDLSLESRSVSFENPTGARGAGGRSHAGRKGSPFKEIEAGERVVLADLEGAGTIRHIWITIPPAQPERMRAVRLEVFYDGLAEPSISVPLVDFFGVPFGRPVHLVTALSAIQEGRGFNAYFPIPFENGLRFELVNESGGRLLLYYQIDYTLTSARDREPSYLHVAYRRENPTVQKRDFVIFDGLRGPGRFLGSVVGIRVLQDDLFAWYGEGEVKMYLDGDTTHPTICGTGLEDYVGTAWAMGAHQAPHQGVPFELRDPARPERRMPDMTSFYRWHLADPVVFRENLRVTIQQIGAVFVLPGEAEKRAAIDALRARSSPNGRSPSARTTTAPRHSHTAGSPSRFGVTRRKRRRLRSLAFRTKSPRPQKGPSTSSEPPSKADESPTSPPASPPDSCGAAASPASPDRTSRA
jgi:hypothetical protein